MKTIGVRELRQNPAPALGSAEQGDVVVITDRGRPVAQLVPLAATWRDRMAMTGRLRLATVSGDGLTPPADGSAGRPPLSDVLAQMRADER